MRLPVTLFAIVLCFIGFTSWRKKEAREAEAARVAAVQDSIRVADSVAQAFLASEERMRELQQASAERAAAYEAKRREMIAAHRDTAPPKEIPVKQRAIMKPGATNRPPLD